MSSIRSLFRGLTAVQVGEESVRLTWEAVNVTGSPVTKYRVFMSLEPIVGLEGEDVQRVDNVTPLPEPTLLVVDLVPGTTYYFTVDAMDDTGRVSTDSLPSASVTLTMPPEEEADPWEVYGPAITAFLIIVIISLVIYVAHSRQRKYGRILSRRPSWEKRNNGGNGK